MPVMPKDELVIVVVMLAAAAVCVLGLAYLGIVPN